MIFDSGKVSITSETAGPAQSVLQTWQFQLTVPGELCSVCVVCVSDSMVVGAMCFTFARLYLIKTDEW